MQAGRIFDLGIFKRESSFEIYVLALLGTGGLVSCMVPDKNNRYQFQKRREISQNKNTMVKAKENDRPRTFAIVIAIFCQTSQDVQFPGPF